MFDESISLRRKKIRIRFGVRFLFLIVTCAAILSLWIGLKYRDTVRSRNAVVEAAGLGWRVHDVSYQGEWYPGWHQHLTGIHPYCTLLIDQPTLPDQWRLLGELPDIQTFFVGGSHEGVADLDLTEWNSLDNLQSLTISKCSFSPMAFANFVERNGLCSLRDINLNGHQLDGRIATSIVKISTLEHVYLSDSRFDDRGLEQIVRLPALKTLSLDSTRVTDAGVVHLHKSSSLEYLNLNSTNIGDSSARHIAKLPLLKQLVLSGTKISDEGIRLLGGCQNIESLSLNDTAVTDQGVISVSRLQSLRTLELEGTRISDNGLKSLAQSKTLRYVTLSKDCVTSGAIMRLRATSATNIKVTLR